MKNLHMKIDGMVCGGCVEKVDKALRDVEGLKVERVSQGEADVAFEPTEVNQQQVVSAIREAGFTVREASVH